MMTIVNTTDILALTIRDMLEELMDDDDEVCKMNLSSRPSREERRRLRERERLERGMERCGLALYFELVCQMGTCTVERTELEQWCCSGRN